MKRVRVYRYKVGEAVCVAVRIGQRTIRWCMGVIVNIPSNYQRTYEVSVYVDNDVVHIGEAIRMYLPCLYTGSREDQWKALILARISSEVFLRAFVKGDVLLSRRRYAISDDRCRLCPANPKDLFERMFHRMPA